MGLFDIFGGAVTAYGDLQVGDFQKRIADLNSGFSEMSAKDAVARGDQLVGLNQIKTTQTLGAQKVGYAASGVDPGVGTPLQAMDDTRLMSTLDKLTIKNNAAREAWGYEVQGYNYEKQGELDQMKSRYAAAASLLNGASGTASSIIALK